MTFPAAVNDIVPLAGLVGVTLVSVRGLLSGLTSLVSTFLVNGLATPQSEGIVATSATGAGGVTGLMVTGWLINVFRPQASVIVHVIMQGVTVPTLGAVKVVLAAEALVNVPPQLLVQA